MLYNSFLFIITNRIYLFNKINDMDNEKLYENRIPFMFIKKEYEIIIRNRMKKLREENKFLKEYYEQMRKKYIADGIMFED